jgi:Immunoglobulin I-set domain
LPVAAAPIFLTADSSPRDVNASVGDDVHIQCNPYAIPDADVLWYKNGELLDREYRIIVSDHHSFGSLPVYKPIGTISLV